MKIYGYSSAQLVLLGLCSDSRCEACFEEIESLTCPECDSEVQFQAWESRLGTATAECQGCGKEIAISQYQV